MSAPDPGLMSRTLTFHGERIKALFARAGETDARVSQVESQLGEMHARVNQVAGDVEHLAALATSGGAGGGSPASPPEPPVSYLGVSDPGEAEAILQTLSVWVVGVYARFRGGREREDITPCWFLHADVTEELWCLYRTHHLAYSQGGYQAVADWLDRLRPRAAERIKNSLAACIDGHRERPPTHLRHPSPQTLQEAAREHAQDQL